jgi:hypothetical protein
MPLASVPTPMPDYYPHGSQLYWDGFSYVTPGLWKAAGPGFWVDPATKHNTVIFAGGVLCYLPTPCSGMIKMNPMMMAPLNLTFTPVNVILSAGWQDNYVTVTGYNNGTFVGKLLLKATTTPKTFTFPASWRVTQLVFTPDFLGTNARIPDGSAVIYKFSFIPNN